MREHTVLRRLVVIRSDHKSRVGAGFASLSRKVDRRRRVVTARSGDYPRLQRPYNLDRHSYDVQPLGLVHRYTLAGRPAWYEQLHAVLHLPFDQRPETIVIDRSIFPKWRYQRRCASAHPIGLRRHISLRRAKFSLTQSEII